MISLFHEVRSGKYASPDLKTYYSFQIYDLTLRKAVNFLVFSYK